jgi:hypothetical protein
VNLIDEKDGVWLIEELLLLGFFDRIPDILNS